MKASKEKRRGGFFEALLREFEFPLERAQAFISAFHHAMGQGLAGRPSALRMLPSFLSRPKGEERGRFLALDLGGTNVRVLEAALNGAGRATLKAVSRSVVPQEVMSGRGEALFDFLAGCVAAFIAEHPLVEKGERLLSFTFSFPTEQLAVDSGRLLAWTKGFTAAGVVGRDVVSLLQDALSRKGLGGIRVAALINDTVGTLMAGAYAHAACDLGVILGTGTNACYPERIERIGKLSRKGEEGEMIINIEWGNFDGLPANRFDAALDRASPNPGRQRMEKMISALYVGELVRLALQETVLSEGLSQETERVFSRPFSLSAEQAALIAEGRVEDSPLLGRFGEKERRVLISIARSVFERSARIAAFALTAVLTWMDPSLTRKHLVAVDGALFEHNPFYREDIRRTLEVILGDRADKVELILVKDGSGIGSAVAGAVAQKEKEALQPESEG
jgi:hexokinase